MSGAVDDFVAIFPQLVAPFFYTGGDRSITPVTDGTLVVPRAGHLDLYVYKNGVQTREFRSRLPTVLEVSSGFSAGDFAGKLQDYKKIFAALCPEFENYTHEVCEYGSHFRTSTDLKVISCGEANGYFDLVVTHSIGLDAPIEAVNYGSRSSAKWAHSGDTNGSDTKHVQNLVHLASFKGMAPEGLVGHCVIVGYQKKPLHSWHGKSTGLFVLDQTSHKARFVPLDLAKAAVAENTVIIPLMYRAAEGDTGEIDWWIPLQMPSGMGDTENVHDQPILKRHRRFEPPPPQAAAPHPAAPEPTPHLEATAPTPAPPVSGVFDNSHAVQLVVDASQVKQPRCKVNTLYWNRGLCLKDANSSLQTADRVVTPFIFPKEMLVCKQVLLCQAESSHLSPDQVASVLQSRRAVVHVDGGQNVDSSFLGARKALVPAGADGGVIHRLNAVFVVHIRDKSQMKLANLSIVSMFAGPKATVVFQADDTKAYFSYWGTPVSVIPVSMGSEVNPEWEGFAELLEDYLAGAEATGTEHVVPVPSHGAGTAREVENMRSYRIPLGASAQGDVCFNDLTEVLDPYVSSDFRIKESIVQHLRAFEFILNKEDIDALKRTVRTVFKSALSSKERTDFFQNIQSLTKSDQEKIRSSAKLTVNLVNRFCCRKYVGVSMFLSEFQEKVAGHGQKGAEKMELGLQCLKFCSSGNISELFDEPRDFMLVAVDPAAVQAAVQKAASSSPQYEVLKPSAGLAHLDPRTPELDGGTVDTLLMLGVPHELETDGPAQFAVPVQGERFSIKSLVFLPIFQEICPDLTQFDATVWAYILCEGMKSSCLVPRDLKTKPRQVEYAVLKLLASFMKSLCDQRTAPVDPESDDVNDSLVKKIRSVYWLIRAVMLKNVGIMTPEPVSTVFDGRANHVIEIEVALEVLPLMCKTGLGPKFTDKLLPSLSEIFVRALYAPIEGVFPGLQEQYKAVLAEEQDLTRQFFKGATLTDSDTVTARIRPRKCVKCLELKSIHEFPRPRMVVEDLAKPEGWQYHKFSAEETKMCLACHGLPERPTLVCPCKHCDGKKGSIFQFTARLSFATHHECIEVAKGIARRVPPKYTPELLGAAGEAGKLSKVPETKIRIPCVRGGPLAVAEKKDVGLPCLTTKAFGQLALSSTASLRPRQFALLAVKLGLLSPLGAVTDQEGQKLSEEENNILKAEIEGIVILMLNNFRASPAWKDIVPNVIAGEHKAGVQLLSMLEAYRKTSK